MNAIRALVLACCVGALADCGIAPTRAQVEAAEDRGCADITNVRQLENEFGLNPNDGGEAGAP